MDLSRKFDIYQYINDPELNPTKQDGVWHVFGEVEHIHIKDTQSGCAIFPDAEGTMETALELAHLLANAPKMLSAILACHDYMHDLYQENTQDLSVGIFKDEALDRAYFSLKAAILSALNTDQLPLKGKPS
jgi:hypothetical protein